MFGVDVSFLRPRHTYPDIFESARFSFRIQPVPSSEIVESSKLRKWRTRKKTGGTSFLPAPPRFSRAFHICVFPTLSCPPHYLRAWNGLFRIRFPSTRIRWIQHTNLQLFESALQSEHFCIRYESRIVRTLIPDIFLSGDITRSSSVLCCEYCIHSFPGSPKAEQDANFARFTTQALLQYSQRSPGY